MKAFLALILFFSLAVFLPDKAFAPPPPAVVDCTVMKTTNVLFGNYSGILPTPLDSTGSITVRCNDNVTVTVSIGASSVSLLIDPRQMASGVNLLNYNLYTDGTYTTIWGDGVVGSTVSNNLLKNKATEFVIYGRIPPLQDAAIGAYTDTLTVTVVW